MDDLGTSTVKRQYTLKQKKETPLNQYLGLPTWRIRPAKSHKDYLYAFADQYAMLAILHPMLDLNNHFHSK
jgi:hypothetical protein